MENVKTLNVYEKLSLVQSKLKAPKSQYNSFGKYAYRNCEDILEAVKPICAEVGAMIVLADEIVNINERYYVKAFAKFIDTKDGSGIENTAYAREELEKKGMDGSQITGSSSSYARKYALNGLLAIDDTKDSDSTNTHGKEKKDEKKPLTVEEARELTITRANNSKAKLKDLTEEQLIVLTETDGINEKLKAGARIILENL